ncbi:MAG: hypothetical protein KGY70_19180, partial [Bacteroidales bacterium]|nr:hypothetical protein [Bacteroidales bacterium]
MEGYLSKNKIDYVLFHLGSVIELTDEIISHLIFQKNDEADTGFGIHMPLSREPLNITQIIVIENIPVFFPISRQGRFYRIENGQVYFNHDILKSSFYLLSGYQEVASKERDEHGRFPYSCSIQKRLNVAHKPIVNYYFEKLAEGIEQFCRLNGISFARKHLFQKWGLMLTHDIDQLSTYNIYELIFRLKIFLGLVPSKRNFSQRRKVFFCHLAGMLSFFNRKNLHWNFGALRRIEKQFGMHSVFYFLPKVRKDQHSFYRIDDPRIRELFEELIQDGCEVGV